MAMDVTVGGAGAESYISVADADAYHSNRGSIAWASATEPAKEQALRRATSWLDATYLTLLPGLRTSGRSQALEWPRSGAADRGGFTIANDEIPVEVKNACAEAALRELETPGVLAQDVAPDDRKILTEVKGIKWQVVGEDGKLQVKVQAADNHMSRIIRDEYETGVFTV